VTAIPAGESEPWHLGGRDRTVFEAFYQRHQNTWRHYAFLHTADGRDAEDVTNHVTRRLVNSWEPALSQESVERYTWSIFKQELGKRLDQRDADTASDFVQLAAFERAARACAWSGQYDSLEESLWLYRAIFHLPPRQHEVMVLHHMMQLTEERTAETLGIVEASVRSNLRHARNCLEEEATARRLLHTTESEG
jgi:RNA polymerase sigma-70 factor (ECF subfamily)